MQPRTVEVVVIGGGPAGLSAATLLGRCRRDVVVFDDGNYRNAVSPAMHGFLTRDGTSPRELRELAHADLARYSSVKLESQAIVGARRLDSRFAVITAGGEEVHCWALLLATGFRDNLPALGGARELFGDLVVPCPYCDAWEVRDEPLAAFSYPNDRGGAFAALLTQWSPDVIFCAERPPELSRNMSRRLESRGVRIEERELRSVERDGEGVRLIFDGGGTVWRRKLFFHVGGRFASQLAEHLGARVDKTGAVEVDRKGVSSVEGLFIAGDATRDVLQAVVAAGEGAAAAVSINEYLCQKELYAERTENL